jgi:hypothetical protein
MKLLTKPDLTTFFYEMKLSFITLLSLFFISVAGGFQKKSLSPLPLGSRLELFIDSFLVESLDNVQFFIHSPKDEGPVLRFDKPWEGPFSTYSTVIKDTDIYRIYYRGLTTTRGEGTNDEVTCYAESSDGIHWIKPDLKIFNITGTLNNNVVLANASPASTNFSPFIDNSVAGSLTGKFKALGGTNKGLMAFSSYDGKHWKKLNENPVLTGESFDSQNVSFWSENEGLYLCYFRKWIPYNGKLIRSIGRSTSPDFIHWSEPVAMDFGNTPAEELYTNQTSPYFRAPHIYIAIAARFFPGKQVLSDEQAVRLKVNSGYYHDCSDAVLLTSRGGNHYQRTFMEGFLRPGIGLNNWISRTNYPALNVVQTGETEISFYVNQDYAQPTSHLQRYSLRTDGFASIHASYETGEMTTRLLTFTGSHLIINFSTSAAGYILAELLDSQNNVIDDFSFDNCFPVIGNEISRQIEWKSGSILKNLKDTPVKIHFKMKDADIYSIRFQ